MRLSEARRDPFRRMAASEGYRSRAAYKLIQIDRKHKILRPGFVVIDFGCAPGGWLQVASKAVGESGFVLGVDLKDVQPPSPNTYTLVADVKADGVQNLILQRLPRKADVVLSDLSPKVSGVWEVDHLKQIDLTERVIQMLPAVLRKGGSLGVKVFEGEATHQLVKKVKELFGRIDLMKPPASRKESSEIYIVGLGYIGRE